MNEKFKDTDLREALRRNYANVPQLPEGGLTLRPLQGKKELKRRRFPLFWREIGGGLSIAACILIAFLLWPKGDEAPITQPVVAEAHKPHMPQPHEPQPQPAAEPKITPAPLERAGERLQQSHEPQQLLAEVQSTPLPEREGLGESPQGEGLESLPLLAEAEITPLLNREGLGESLQRDGERLDETLPPDRQALVDIYLAEEALQVAYKQQEQTQELRAFSARLQGKEPETSHLITSF